MQTRSWDGQDGQKRYRTELVANEVKFLGSRGDDSESGSNFSALSASSVITVPTDSTDRVC